MIAACEWEQPRCDCLFLPAPLTPELAPKWSSGEKQHLKPSKAQNIGIQLFAKNRTNRNTAENVLIKYCLFTSETVKANQRLHTHFYLTVKYHLLSWLIFYLSTLLLQVHYTDLYFTNHWAIEEANRVARRQCGLYPSQVVLGFSPGVGTELWLHRNQKWQAEQGRGRPLWSALQPALVHQGVTERHYLPDNTTHTICYGARNLLTVHVTIAMLLWSCHVDG